MRGGPVPQAAPPAQLRRRDLPGKVTTGAARRSQVDVRTPVQRGCLGMPAATARARRSGRCCHIPWRRPRMVCPGLSDHLAIVALARDALGRGWGVVVIRLESRTAGAVTDLERAATGNSGSRPGGGVPSAANPLPQRPLLHMRTDQTSPGAGQSSGLVQGGGVGQGATQYPRLSGAQHAFPSPETLMQKTPGMSG